MTTLEYAGDPQRGAFSGAFAPGTAADRSSRRWRSIWRLHFYAGMLSMPVLVLMAVTGLLILYAEPIYRTTEGDLQTVSVGDDRVPLDEQLEVAQATVPDLGLTAISTPKEADESMVFTFTADDVTFTDVYVDPYRGDVLGTGKNDYGTGIVGLANRLHADLNNPRVTVPLPSLYGVFNPPEPIMTEMAVGDLVIEIFACWALVLAVSGLYLWWPRKRDTGKALLIPRLRKRGRARWRDLHAVSGILLSFILIFFVVTGLSWSAFWGSNWYAVNQQVAPASSVEEPASTLVKTGDLDVLGNRIPWVSQGEPIPASGGGGGHHGGDEGAEAAPEDATAVRPASLALDDVMQIADQEGMRPGYTIVLPFDSEDEDGNPVYGSYVVADPWPARIDRERTIYLDQFTGETLSESSPKDWGGLAQVTELGVQTHMGTQFGIFSRIAMTFGCLAVLFSSFSALVMWWNRRPRGGAGLPRRPGNVRLARGLVVIAVVIGVVFPLWGLTAIAVLALDHFVIRRIKPLRAAFGMR